ncbi:response regulator, partial [Massilia sp.]
VNQVAAPATPLAARLAGLRVLVVEDNPINQEVANYVLVHAGATVDLAANGRIALSMLAEPGARYDAVLMDLQMPVMNGFEASAAIRAMGATDAGGAALPIVAMSANAMEEDRRRALAAGMDEHLAKPIDVDELVATLERVTGGSRGGSRASGSSGSSGEHRAAPALLAGVPAVPLLPGIDLKATLPRFGGSYAAFAAVFRRFALTQGEAVNEISAQLAQGDRQGATRVAHRLRGVAANLGADDVAARALQLEQALRGADDAQLALRLADLEAAMVQVAEIARELAPAAPEPGPETQALPDSVRAAALAELLELLQNNNMKAMSAYDALRPALAGMLAPAESAALQEAVGTLRFEQAARQVRAILVAKGDS